MTSTHYRHGSGSNGFPLQAQVRVAAGDRERLEPRVRYVGRPAPPVSVPSSCQSSRHSWAELLRGLFEVEVLTCPTCGSRRRLLALISDPPVVRKILRHLGLPTDPPALAPVRLQRLDPWEHPAPGRGCEVSRSGLCSFWELLWNRLGRTPRPGVSTASWGR